VLFAEVLQVLISPDGRPTWYIYLCIFGLYGAIHMMLLVLVLLLLLLLSGYML